MPFESTSALEVAARGHLFKRSSVSLVCLPDGPHLLVKARLAAGFMRPEIVRDSERLGWTGYTSSVRFDFAALSQRSLELETMADVHHGRTVDRMVTDLLAPTQRQVVRQAVARGMPGTLSVGFGEFGIHRMTPRASLAELDTALAACPGRSSVDGPSSTG